MTTGVSDSFARPPPLEKTKTNGWFVGLPLASFAALGVFIVAVVVAVVIFLSSCMFPTKELFFVRNPKNGKRVRERE